MLRPSLATALIAALPLPALAQGPGRPAILMLRDLRREPVADVQGVLLFDPPIEMPALDAVGGLDHALGREPRIGLTDRSRRTGLMSCPFPDDAGSAAMLLTTPDGLGVFLPRVLRGEPLPVQLEPCGHVRTADGKPFTLYANALAGGRRIPLPALQADDVPLPPGVYEGWIDTAQGVVWQRLAVQPNAATVVATDGAGIVVQRTGDAIVWPAGRRDLVLLGPDRAEVRLLGLATASQLIAHSTADGRLHGFSARGADGTVLPVPLGEPAPPHEFVVRGPDGAPLAHATAFVVRNGPTGQTDVSAEAAVENGRCRIAEPTGGDDWLLVVAPGAAPLAMPWPEAVRAVPLQLIAGHAVPVACTVGSGEPAIDVRLEIVPERAAPATIAVRTDRRGRALIEHAILPATVVAADPAFANAAVLATVDTGTVQLHLDTGRVLRGKVVLPDGAAAGGATITLRDPQGRLRPRERTTTTAADGTFVFGGLGDAAYSLFVTQQRQGHTWSSRIVAATAVEPTAGGDSLVVEIHDEDPQLRPPGR